MSEATLTMPRLGETMERGEIVGWLVDVGQSFARGDPLVEVETDKTVVEFPALGDGTITERLAEPGETIDVGAPIARVDIGDGPDWTRNDDAKEGAAPAAAGNGGAEPAAMRRVERGAGSRTPLRTDREAGAPIRATPKARRLARQNGVDLAGVPGSGRRGRIEARDIEAAIGSRNMSDGLSIADGIAYLEAGPASGPPYLLVHGFAGDHTTFAKLANGLTKAGRRVVALDLPGHGATTVEAPTIDALSAPLDAFSRSIFADGVFHIVAHSVGALPATALAERANVASLTLIAPAGIGLSINRHFVAGMADPSSVGEVSQLLRLLSDGPSALSQAAIADIFAQQSRRRLKALAQALLGTEGQGASIVDALDRLSIDKPVRVLLGHRDRIFDWREAIGLSPRIAVHHFPRAGHLPHAESPHEALDILTAGERR